MAVTSTMVQLSSPMPGFALPDVTDGTVRTASDFTGTAMVVIFLSNHCPYVKRIAAGLAAFSADLVERDVSVVAVASNDEQAYPEDAPAALARVAAEQGYQFPIVFDAEQEVAKAFSAACTPDFFVYGPDRTLVYRGQFDSARPGNEDPVTGADLRAAVEAVLGEAPAPLEQLPSMGCSIKWRPGNEPPLALG